MPRAEDLDPGPDRTTKGSNAAPKVAAVPQGPAPSTKLFPTLHIECGANTSEAWNTNHASALPGMLDERLARATCEARINPECTLNTTFGRCHSARFRPTFTVYEIVRLPKRSVRMAPLSEFVLRNKLLVVLFWIAVLAGGVFASSGVGGRLSKNFSFPGQPGYEANVAILKE